VFKFIKENSLFTFRIEKIYLSLAEPKIRVAKLLLILKVFDELKIFSLKKRGDSYKITINTGKKVSLSESKILKRALGK
jgi:hypothetical protein